MQTSKRTLAVDLGTRRVGIAISDDGGRFATPLSVLEITSPEAALAQVLAQIKQHQPGRIIVGLPLNMDGSISAAARKTMEWGKRLAESSGLSVSFVDERLSSFEAEQQLSQRRRQGERLTHQKKKQRRDALAAAMFLQDFLDGKISSEITPESEDKTHHRAAV